MGLGRDEREVAQVEAREEVDDGAPGSLEEMEDHFFVFRLEKVCSFRKARSLSLWASGSEACEPTRIERDARAAGPKGGQKGAARDA